MGCLHISHLSAQTDAMKPALVTRCHGALRWTLLQKTSQCYASTLQMLTYCLRTSEGDDSHGADLSPLCVCGSVVMDLPCEACFQFWEVFACFGHYWLHFRDAGSRRSDIRGKLEPP